MNAETKVRALDSILTHRGIELPLHEIAALRRAQMTLHRWAEEECGNSDDFRSWSIERDEKTGKPYRVIYPHSGNASHRHAIPDRERGALARVRKICAAHGLFYFHQTDPRGCALYIAREPLTDSCYTNGIPVCD